MKLNLFSILTIISIIIFSKSENTNEDQRRKKYIIKVDDLKRYPDICIKTGDLIEVVIENSEISFSEIHDEGVLEVLKYNLYEGRQKGQAYIKLFKKVDFTDFLSLGMAYKWKDKITVYVDDCYGLIKSSYYSVLGKEYQYEYLDI